MRPAPRLLVLSSILSIGLTACSAGPSDRPAAQAAVEESLETVELALLERPRTPRVRVERMPDRIAFLPMLNRGSRLIHPMLLDGPSETLSVLSRLVDGIESVRPDVLAGILRESGRSDWFESPTPFVYDDSVLEIVADRTGAGTIAWSEIGPDDAVVMTARAMTPGANDGIWKDIRIEPGPGQSIDRHVFDVPRKLILALSSRMALRSTTPVSAEERARFDEAIESAREQMWTGQAGPLRRAEQALADLALRYPGRPEPWIELAFLRVLRPIVLGEEFRHELMLDGPNPARHFALRFEDLDEAQRARLAFIDHAYVGEGDRLAEYLAFLDGLPPRAPERVLLAFLQEREHKDRFRIPAGVLPGYLGWVLTELAAIEGRSEQRAWAWQLVQDPKHRQALVLVPLVTHHVRREVDSTSRWSMRLPVRRPDLAQAGIEALEVWRHACLSLEAADRRSACVERVAAFVRTYAPDAEVDETSLRQSASWQRLADGLVVPLMEAKLPEAVAHSLAEDAIQFRDPGFGGILHLLERVIEESNAIASLVDDDRPIRASVESVLMTDGRRLLGGDVDWILAAAEQPMQIGRMRGRADEWEPYRDALQAFSDRYLFRDLMEIDAWLAQRGRRRMPEEREKKLLADHQPYAMPYVSVAHRQLRKRGRLSRAQQLERLVPTMGRLVAEAHNLERKAGELGLAYDGLQRQMARRPDTFAVEIRDKVMKDLGRPKDERLAALLEGEALFALDHEIEARIANLAMELEQYDVAAARYSHMRQRSLFQRQGCHGLAEIERRKQRPDALEAVMLDCAASSVSNFDRASAWTVVAGQRRDQGRLVEALEASRAARGVIGDASHVLLSQGYILELMGDHAAAEAVYRLNDATYDGASDGRIAVAIMALRRGRPAEAIEIVRHLAMEPRYHTYDLSDTARLAFLAAGDLAGFRPFALGLGQQGLISLAEAEWQVDRNLDESMRLLDLAAEGDTECACVPLRRARILREAGRVAEALDAAKVAWTRQQNFVIEHELVRARIAAGDLAWVRDHVARSDAWNPDGWLARVMLAAAEGDLAGARRQVASFAERMHPVDSTSKVNWAWQLRPLLLFETTLVDRVGTHADDQRLLRLLEFATNGLAYDARLWEALSMVRRKLGDQAGAVLAERRMLALWPHRDGAAPVASSSDSVDSRT
ncbi:MAG: hypothetical protein R3F35_15600 [Myxococcota bacterium]